jgi:type II secretory pathway component PulC
MTRKLMLLDLALAVLVSFLAWQMRREWVEAHARAQAFLSAQVKQVPAKPLAALPRVSPLMAIFYAEVAQLDLFSKDRNPQVILDPVAPPKPKPIPPFPVASGVLLWDGTPPVVVLSLRPGGRQKAYHPGEQIGDWKIVSVDNQYVVFEWDGREFKKRIDEIMDRSGLAAENTPATAPAPAAAPNAASAPQAQSLADSKKSDHWVDVGSTDTKMCKPGDDTAPGTVLEGFKKVVSSTPFGNACRWEQVK